MSSQKTVEKNGNGHRTFGRTRKRRLRVHRKASSGRNVRRKITALAVLLSLLMLAFPFTKVTQAGSARETIAPQGGLPQADIDAINALAAFNIGTPYQPPQALPSGVVMATEIGSDVGFPPLFNGPLKSVKVLLPIVREAAIRSLRYWAGGAFMAPTASTPLPPHTLARVTGVLLAEFRPFLLPASAKILRVLAIVNRSATSPIPNASPVLQGRGRCAIRFLFLPRTRRRKTRS
jgi:hypothetical protein